MKHTLSVLVENRSGVLSRVSAMFARRGFNIESLAVGPTQDPELSRMTIVVDADDNLLEQVTKQLHKLINVIKISELGVIDAVEREMVLLKVFVPADKRAEIQGLVDVFRAKIIDVSKETVTIEITGTSEKVTAFETLCKDYGIQELVRTGKIALARGTKSEM